MSLLKKMPIGPYASSNNWIFDNKRIRRNVLLLLGLITALALVKWQSEVHRERRVRTWSRYSKGYHFISRSDFSPVSMPTENKTMAELCTSFPQHLLQNIQPVLKTGYTDPSERMAGQMDGPSACFKPGDLLIFSDAPGDYAGHKAIDVLALLPESYHEFEAFKPYLEQRRMIENGSAVSKPEMLNSIDGWKIDKFKFLVGIEQAWLRKPNRDFYVFYESDTYIFWDPLFRYLQSKDPDALLYMGSGSPGGNNKDKVTTWFGNGGPGFVLSRGAMKRLLKRKADRTGQYIDPPFTEKWRHKVHDGECCGDAALGYVLWDVGIELQALYPMFTQHLLHSLPFESNRWCSPVFSVHKPSVEQMHDMARWEYAARENDHPLRHCDIYHFYKPGTKQMIPHWINTDIFSRLVPSELGISSRDECESHCRGVDRCMQWSWIAEGDKRECFITEDCIYHGAEHPHSTAGWMSDRIQMFLQEHKCSDTFWDGPSLAKTF